LNEIKIKRNVLEEGIESVASACINCDKDDDEKGWNRHQSEELFEEIISGYSFWQPIFE